MHQSSLNRMSEFVKAHLNPNDNLKILDAGSYDVNGTYKPIFENPNWQYFGLDIEAGPNVDIVVPLYEWDIEEEYDVIISGQALEHVKDMNRFMLSICKAIKIGGLVCVIVPSLTSSGRGRHWAFSQQEHKYPVDCWRVLPDGMEFLLKEICDLEIIKVWRQDGDCIGIAKKRLVF